MPLVDDQGKDIDITREWCLQSEEAQQRTVDLIEIFKEELEDDFGKFTTRTLWTGRVLIEPTLEEPYVAYLSSEKEIEPRLVVDDLAFEIWEEWVNVEPLPKPVKPKNLGG